MKNSSAVEDLDNSLEMPSFEEELAASDVCARSAMFAQKTARFVTCRVCGVQVLVGPDDIFKCPNSPHDTEDDLLSEDDIMDEDESNDELYELD